MPAMAIMGSEDVSQNNGSTSYYSIERELTQIHPLAWWDLSNSDPGT